MKRGYITAIKKLEEQAIKQKGYTSKYIGVSIKTNKGRRKEYKYYIARIQKDKKIHYIGHFKSELMAAIAYNNEAIKLYGESAVLNDIKKVSSTPKYI